MTSSGAAHPVQLIVTPFLPREQPALGVSTLKALLSQQGVESEVVYLNLAFLQTCPPPLYDIISHAFSPTLLGEMLFARALWGDAAPTWSEYFGALEKSREDRLRGVHASISMFADELTEDTFWKRAPALIEPLYERAPEVIGAWADQILMSDPRIVGFTTTFQQNTASLALAQELKRRRGPDKLTILFGGANCEGPMGRALARNFPFIDYVISGEAESIVSDLVPDLLSARPHHNSTGKEQRDDQNVAAARSTTELIEGKPLHQLDSLPLPDFGDYLQTYNRNGFTWPYQLSAETSRGCWWGVKSHCTFCGLNGSSMAYRSKSPQRAVTELQTLSSRYGSKRLMMADNILDTRYLTSVLPQLQGQGLDLFYEVKSNLKKSGLRTMRAAGVSWIQPGIESLSDLTLKLMGKGTTAMQNIQLLRWCAEFDIKPSWNILYGFPGEDVGEFEVIAQTMSGLHHLDPPSGVLPFRMDRFSPYFNEPADHQLTNVRPYWSYRYAYPGLADADLAEIAYFFEFDYIGGRDPRQDSQSLVRACIDWDNAHRNSAALRLVAGDVPCVYDSRSGEAIVTELSALEHQLLCATDSAVGLEKLLSSRPDLEPALQLCREHRWVYEDQGRIVRLVVEAEPVVKH